MRIEGTVLRCREFEPIEGRVVVENGEIAASVPVITAPISEPEKA